MADTNSVVYPKFTGWVGESVFIHEGEPWAADDPFVVENPQHFRLDAGTAVRRSGPSPVEQATAAPGEKRTTSTGRKTSQ